MNRWFHIAALVGCLAALPAAWSGEAAPDWFAAAQITEVRLTMAPADWEALRHEHQDLLAVLGPTRFDTPPPKPYHTYRAELAVDGVKVGAIGLRKRGFLGSSSFTRPSLGLRLDEYEPARRWAGLRRLALNNNQQDASQMHQWLAYRVFAAAGVPAPRCRLVRVTLNQTNLGLYSGVEPVEAEFLKRQFGSAEGNLYEGVMSDFRPNWVNTFERKNHQTRSDRSDLAAVVSALESPDEQLTARLEPVVDLDAYLTFWAVETLVEHWDSYSSDGNNFFVYRVPAKGRFVFVPWGTDSVLGDPDPFAPGPLPASVRAMSLLPRRLYLLPKTREQYRARLREVLKTAWREKELLAELDRLEILLRPHLTQPHTFEQGVAKVRRFIRERRAALNAELDAPAPVWPYALKSSGCLKKTGTLTADFQTRWPAAGEDAAEGTANLTLILDGETRKFLFTKSRMEAATDHRSLGFPTLSLPALDLRSLRLRVPAFVITPEQYQASRTVAVDGFNVFGMLLEMGLDTGTKFDGMVMGTLQLRAAGRQPGEKVSGRITADVHQFAP